MMGREIAGEENVLNFLMESRTEEMKTQLLAVVVVDRGMAIKRNCCV